MKDPLHPSFHNMLQTLENFLRKVRDQDAPDALLDARLVSDMLPLFSQVVFVLAQVHEAIARLRDVPVPATLQQLLTDARVGERSAGVDELMDLVASTRRAVADLEGPIVRDETAMVEFSVPSGLDFEMTVEDYAVFWVLPQFYFHLVTAYAILRHCGMNLGKADYVPHMTAYIQKAEH